MINTHFNTTIKTLRTDNGGEYLSSDFQHYLALAGTSHQRSCPYTPQQNGVAERKHRHIVESTRALLHHSHLPYTHWSDAALTATYLINRLPSRNTSHSSPYQLLYRESPSYSHLRPFGCSCFAFLPSQQPHKLAPPSLHCLFLGYSSSHKGYICFHPPTLKYFISRHVRFDEHDFPGYSITTSTQSPTTTPSFLLQPNPAFTFPSQPSPTTHNPRLITSPIITPELSTSTPLSASSNPEPSTSSTSPPESTETSPQAEHSSPPPLPHTSTHPMTTRSRHGIVKPRQILNLSASTNPPNPTPTSYKHALASPPWRSAMLTELDALHRQHTWDLVPLPSPHTKVVGSTWTFKLKVHPDGSIARHKARLVAQGYTQTQGVDYTDTFSPVAKYTTIRLFFLSCLEKEWPITHMDVSNAFLHGKLTDTIYMRQPPGFVDPVSPQHVCLLRKAIYGLKQSPRLWFAALTTELRSFGFLQSSADPSLFHLHRPSGSAHLLIYVDDLLLAASSTSLLQQIKGHLHKAFIIKDLGSPKTFLGIQLAHCDGSILLHQTAYIQQLLLNAGLAACAPAATPQVASRPKIVDNSDFGNPTLYRRLTGSLQYLTITRPDIAYAVNVVCQHMHSPSNYNYQQLVRIIRYLKGTSSFGLPIGPGGSTLSIYSDSDWAGDHTDRKSTTGYCIFLGPTLVSWRVQKQQTVARSSTEAEYRALASATTELIWLRRLLQDFQLPYSPPAQVFCDNKSAIAIASNPVLHARTKHIEIDRHFVREQLQAHAIHLQHLPTSQQLADILTKPLPKSLFKRHCTNLTIKSLDR